MAHELGHNFGMQHDFDLSHGGNGEFGGPCDGKGIMSYNNPPLVWSSCSKSDFQEQYANQQWGNGCLEDISGEVVDNRILNLTF